MPDIHGNVVRVHTTIPIELYERFIRILDDQSMTQAEAYRVMLRKFINENERTTRGTSEDNHAST